MDAGSGQRGRTGRDAGWGTRRARIDATPCQDPSAPAPAIVDRISKEKIYLSRRRGNLDHVVVVVEFLGCRIDRMKERLGTRVIHNNPQNLSAISARRAERIP